ncbi:MAG: hypothetical protein M3R06_09405 [Chloroflexota bacterium]|nr:hypothetical protein [Chloroflexota bacterium]
MPRVRVEERVHGTLRELANVENRSIGQVIEAAVDRYQKDKFWKEMHEGFTRLRVDPAAWETYEVEAAAWDPIRGNGLEDEEPYFTDEAK